MGAHLAERLKHARAELRHMLEIEKAQEHRAQTVRAKYLRNKVRTRQLSNILRSVKMKNLRALKLARNKVRNGPLQVLVRRLTASRKKEEIRDIRNLRKFIELNTNKALVKSSEVQKAK